MKDLPLVVVLLLASFVNRNTLAGPIEKELQLYRARVNVLYDKLIQNGCPSYTKTKRLIADNPAALLEVEKQLFNKMFDQWIECRELKMQTTTSTPTTTTSTTTTPTTTTSTTTKPTTTTSTTTKQTTTTSTTTKPTSPTTTQPMPPTTRRRTTPTTTKQTTTAAASPKECESAITYTEPWRLDNNGSNIKPITGLGSESHYACDLQMNTSMWFRFSGAAGTHMLSSCPTAYSCGAKYPIWTDDKMPKGIGKATEVEVYQVADNNCREVTHSVNVVRCSWDTDNDFVYKAVTESAINCGQAFCGEK